MTDRLQPVKVKLVTIIGSSIFSDRIAGDLQNLGVTGYTKTKAEGLGVHGAQKFGLVAGANVRIETLVAPALAGQILEAIGRNFAGQAVIAFAMDAEAVPASHFS